MDMHVGQSAAPLSGPAVDCDGGSSDRTISAMQIFFTTSISNASLREQCVKLMRGLIDGHRLAGLAGANHSYELEAGDAPEIASEVIRDLILEVGDRAVVVISDGMAGPRAADARPGVPPRLTPWWSGVVLDPKLPQERLGSIAIANWAPVRVPDVDRVIPPEFDETALQDALIRVVRTLEYNQRPIKRPLGRVVTVRHIKGPGELRDYYRLRHRIYSLMGYLDHRIEAVPARMELDWCDRNSVPIGAFELTPGGAKLIGTARLITPRIQYPDMVEETEALVAAADDPDGVLGARFSQPYPFQMPFLETHPDDSLLDVLQRKHAQTFCELSRVIIDDQCRGFGLSKLIVNYAMSVARWMGMDWMFLECLPTHRELYAKFGFRIVPGRKQRVYNINKTMDLMEWSPAAASPSGPASPRGPGELRDLRARGYLCLCWQHRCPSPLRPEVAPYALLGKEGCPFAGDVALPPERKHLWREYPKMEPFHEE